MDEQKEVSSQEGMVEETVVSPENAPEAVETATDAAPTNDEAVQEAPAEAEAPVAEEVAPAEEAA